MATAAPAPAEALKKTHLALLQDLNELEATFRPAEALPAPAAANRLRRTRAHIAEHFRFEEVNGYLATVLERRPNLDREVQALLTEHRRLEQEVDRLIVEAQLLPLPETTLAEQVHAWVKAVRTRGAHENRVVLDCFDLDIGTKD